MSLPIPKPGLVIRYGFLWSNEEAKGATEGTKDRLCAIVVAVRRDPNGEIDTIVAPITHRPPEDPTHRISSISSSSTSAIAAGRTMKATGAAFWNILRRPCSWG